MSRSADEILRDGLAHFERLQAYAKNDLEDQLVIDAICMRLSAGVEALNRLEVPHLERLFGDWRRMWGMRNRIAHGYLLVDAEIVKETVTQEIPGIMRLIRTELGEEP